jgi:Zn finger protein HypA/HybF involved in hydrogenase expression
VIDRFNPKACRNPQFFTKNCFLSNPQSNPQSQSQIQTKIAAMETSLAAAKTQFDSAQAPAASYKAELSQKSGAKPLIIESLDKANAALVLIPNDAELKTNVTSLTVKIQQLDLRISELNEMVAKANEATITTNAQMEVAANNVNGQCPTSNPTGQLLEQQPFIRCGNEIAAS